METNVPEKFHWVEIRPTSGIITKADAKKLGVNIRCNGYGYRCFETSAHARSWYLLTSLCKLTKVYEVRFFVADEPSLFYSIITNNIPITTFQEHNYVII